MLLFYFIFFVLVIFSLLAKDEKKAVPFFICAGIILFLLAAFRRPGLDRDYLGYIAYYNDVLHHSFARVEPFFILIVHIVDKLFNNNLYLFIIYAFLGISLKFFAINRLTTLPMLSVLIYFSGFFLLFDMTQIRAGVAAGILLLCIEPIKERKLGKFLILVVLASLFHYSALSFIPFYFLRGDSLNIKLYVFLIPVSYIIYYSKVNLFFFTNYIPIQLVQIKMNSYFHHATVDSSINVFNMVHLSRCILAYLFLWKWKLMSDSNIYIILLIKIYFIALFIFVAFGSVPGFSSRISELLLVVEIILIPYLAVIMKPKYLSVLITVGIAFVFLSFSLFYTKLFHF
jgi:hypothetical protein